MNLLKTIPLFCLFFLCSCGSKYLKLTKSYQFTEVNFNAKVKSLNIDDKRLNVEDREMKIPALTFPGNKDKLSPKLSEKHRRIIDSTFRAYFNSEAPEYDVTISISRGEKEFFATAFSEVENVFFDIKVELKNSISQKTLIAKASAHYTANSIDASREFLETMYEFAIKTAIHKSIDMLHQMEK